jgi:type II secretory pathway pseudopilin PulG
MFRLSKNSKGLTLVELMIVSLVLVVTIVTLLVVFINALNQIALAKEISIATEDLRDTLEKMKTTPFSAVTTQFPDGASVSESVVGGFNLRNENIIVRYPSGTGVDPLVIDTEISWLGKDGRTRSQTFRTIRTRMF